MSRLSWVPRRAVIGPPVEPLPSCIPPATSKASRPPLAKPAGTSSLATQSAMTGA
ncbi:uncharacterized protein CC84DRAFT_1169682 [Paraphaeosphaeria sporulosa]|uniref:Uncharacterized protein n=1 Tax=Paraphaeosphaeria sporulosa TaxID=1460663 RepID=A0A177BVF5_9PLEO|nr:uncharacterized protein CC84DRAFT_1169682 [Paraphaeosphaeria sporulosa]OAF98950.1 hypothetical protein CC84DRAFT_1169682 [Paraphaeosphaeria sporulosa]